MSEKMYIRGNKDVAYTECKKCNKKVIKNDSKQIVYFCSKKCRKEFRNK